MKKLFLALSLMCMGTLIFASEVTTTTTTVQQEKETCKKKCKKACCQKTTTEKKGEISEKDEAAEKGSKDNHEHEHQHELTPKQPEGQGI